MIDPSTKNESYTKNEPFKSKSYSKNESSKNNLLSLPDNRIIDVDYKIFN